MRPERRDFPVKDKSTWQISLQPVADFGIVRDDSTRAPGVRIAPHREHRTPTNLPALHGVQLSNGFVNGFGRAQVKGPFCRPGSGSKQAPSALRAIPQQPAEIPHVRIPLACPEQAGQLVQAGRFA